MDPYIHAKTWVMCGIWSVRFLSATDLSDAINYTHDTNLTRHVCLNRFFVKNVPVCACTLEQWTPIWTGNPSTCPASLSNHDCGGAAAARPAGSVTSAVVCRDGTAPTWPMHGRAWARILWACSIGACDPSVRNLRRYRVCLGLGQGVFTSWKIGE
jgi:hypothetical protein